MIRMQVVLLLEEKGICIFKSVCRWYMYYTQYAPHVCLFKQGKTRREGSSIYLFIRFTGFQYYRTSTTQPVIVELRLICVYTSRLALN